MKNCLFLILINLLPCLVPLSGQVPYEKNLTSDVLHYDFSLMLNDSTNEISGLAEVTVHFENVPQEFNLDLIAGNGESGMEVTEVREGRNKVSYRYTSDKIRISPGQEGGNERTYTILYHGIPERGLVIDTTKYGNRSFFGDNWPDLARHWLPCVDHPSDKASVEFRITAPAHYDVVATGKKIEESYISPGYKLTRYHEPAPVATKVMTIGVCEFASSTLGYAGDVEISAWVYPENRLEGFSDYSPAVEVMNYFIESIGPYAFAKLANMQAKTQWGGLENAGTIAYRESSVTGKNEVEDLIAHEIAHQWFGNSATEASWNHVWLSEGFATYFTILYLEHVYGDERRKSELMRDREEILAYYERNPSPIVDNSITEAMNVLSTNTYQKGGWVLNMLRHKLGDETFWKGIREYYSTFRNSNALTEDLQKIMENVSGENLEEFFHQWIYVKGFPEIRWDWHFKKGRLEVTIEQQQEHQLFRFPIEVGIRTGESFRTETLDVTSESNTFSIELADAPDEVILDPNVWLLYREAR